MQNLNKVKGNASKLEEMMRKSSFQPIQKHRKLKRSHTEESNVSSSSVDVNEDNENTVSNSIEDRDIFQCNCDDHDEEEINVPRIQDFIYEIENSRVIEDVEKSRQLLLLIQLFLKVKNLNPSEDNNMNPTLKLPPLEQ